MAKMIKGWTLRTMNYGDGQVAPGSAIELEASEFAARERTGYVTAQKPKGDK